MVPLPASSVRNQRQGAQSSSQERHHVQAGSRISAACLISSIKPRSASAERRFSFDLEHQQNRVPVDT